MDSKKLEEFFEFIKNMKSVIEEQKRRGLNDYNPLLEVLKASDEVRLHSRILGSILNPNGKHYQNDLFLKKFIELLNINKFDTQNAILKKEYENIDIYLTDGNKHIIIENKIYADDQSCQISRYVKTIKEQYGANDEDIFVIYITNQIKNCPDGHLCENDYIKPNTKCKELIDFKIKYTRLSYQKDILSWLKECQREIRNITNLNIAFEFYIQAIQKITKQFKGAVMDIYEKIVENPEYSYLALEINQTKLKIELIKKFFEELENNFSFYGYFHELKISNELTLDKYLEDFFNKQKNRAKDFGIVYNLDNNYKLLIFIGTEWLHYGIIQIENNNIKNFKQNSKLEELIQHYQWIYRANWKLKWYSKNVINLRKLNLNSIKKLTIDRNKFIEEIKNETTAVLKILKENDS